MPLLMEAARYKRRAEEWRRRAETAADASTRRECEAVARQYEEVAAQALAVRPAGRAFLSAHVREGQRDEPPFMRVRRRKKRPEGGTVQLPGEAPPQAEAQIQTEAQAEGEARAG